MNTAGANETARVGTAAPGAPGDPTDQPAVPAASRPADCPIAAAVAALTAAVDALQAVDVSRLDEAGLLAALDAVERQARRLPAVRDTLVAEAKRRDVPTSHAARSVSAWLQARFLIGRGEARTWLRGADRLTPRLSLTGEPLDPVLPALAAARAAGALSPAQVKVIDDLDDELPTDLPDIQRRDIEIAMVNYAEQHDPNSLIRIGQRLLDVLDPDGTDPIHDEARRRRGLTIGPLRNGLARINGLIDAWTREALLNALAPLADPDPTNAHTSSENSSSDRDDSHNDAGSDNHSGAAPAADDHSNPGTDDGGGGTDGGSQRPLDPDRRSRPQRLHDALRQLCERHLTSGLLPRRGGTAATILLTIPLANLEARTGYASSTHDADIPTREVIRRAPDSTFIPIVIDRHGNPLYVGRRRRLANWQQRHALHVRDGGCIIPGCSTPSQDCQPHHLIDWASGGTTDITNLALLCEYHHHRINGWTLQLTHGRIWCTPPPWIRGHRTKTVNNYFRGTPPQRLFE